MSASLDAYLERIGYQGPVQADLATLRALHRAHLLAVPYENFDVQLGRPLTTDPQAAFDKIVRRRRGGWCYEMNGCFGLALEAVGFKVTRLSGAVWRERLGDLNRGSHLVLRVDLDEPWLADVGYGDGPIEPFRPVLGPYRQRMFDFDCEATEDGWLRFRNHPHAPRSFDLKLEAADEAELADRCQGLQSAPHSVFVGNAIAQRHTPEGLILLRNRSLKRVEPDGTTEHEIASADELVQVLKAEFDLDLPEAAGLWPRICAQHEAALAALAAAAS